METASIQGGNRDAAQSMHAANKRIYQSTSQIAIYSIHFTSEYSHNKRNSTNGQPAV
jgi:hypothetical protein